MPRIFASFSMAAILVANLGNSVSASPSCLSGQKPYALASDIVDWTMSIAPGADCIQGLRWSYMQIELVSIIGAPKNGKVVVVGSGFRYFADPSFRGSDSFTVVVSGKNLKTPGNSVLQIEVKAREQTVQLSSAQDTHKR